MSAIWAASFAANAHRHQVRKGGQGSYICHPLRVASLLDAAGAYEETVIIGLLHDVLEDTDTDYNELVYQFGEPVADAVRALSDDKALPKADRKSVV